MDAMKLLTALTLRSPQNSTELMGLGIAELIVQAMKVHSNDDKLQVFNLTMKILKCYILKCNYDYNFLYVLWLKLKNATVAKILE